MSRYKRDRILVMYYGMNVRSLDQDNIEAERSDKYLHLNPIMVIPQLEQQLLQLSFKDKLYIIQLLAQSLTTPDRKNHPNQPSKLSEFFRQSPLAEVSEELDLSRDRSLPRDDFTL